MISRPCQLLLLAVSAVGLRVTKYNGKVPQLTVASDDENFDQQMDSKQGLKLDWAITKSVAKHFPIKVKNDSAVSLARVTMANDEAQREYAERIWVFGSHNRAGCTAIYNLAELQANSSHVMMCAAFGKFGWAYRWCKKHDPRIWFLSDLTGEHLRNFTAHNRSFRAVNLVRDPIAMVISGYIMHLHSDDTPEELLAIRKMSTEEGLKAEADFQLRYGIRSMLDAYQHAPAPQTLHARFENFAASPESYDAETRRVYEHTMGDLLQVFYPAGLDEMVRLASDFDMTRKPHSMRGGLPQDVVDAQVSHLVQVMPQETLERLRAARETLGYM